MGINWKHRKVIVSIVMCVLLCVTAITAMMYTAFGAGSSNIKNVNAPKILLFLILFLLIFFIL